MKKTMKNTLKNTMNQVQFVDLRFGEVFMDTQSNIYVKVNNLINPDYNAVYLSTGLLTSWLDDELVTRLNYEKDWYEG